MNLYVVPLDIDHTVAFLPPTGTTLEPSLLVKPIVDALLLQLGFDNTFMSMLFDDSDNTI